MNDIAGKKFGRLTALRIVGKTTDNRPAWLCRCECGNEKIVSEHNLKRNNTKSCGCYREEVRSSAHYKHGRCNTRLYRVWNNMRTRCDRPKNDNYEWYGGRGITYCTAWSDFSVFAEWALSHGYSDELELDRIDTNGAYEPSNCRFVTHKENCNNRRGRHGSKNTLEKAHIA